MSDSNICLYRARNANEVLYNIKNVKDLIIYGGGTSLHSTDNSVMLNTSSSFLFLFNIEDYRHIEKRERYIDFGSAVTLSEILNLGESNIPKFFYSAIKEIANPTIQNIATIGGNICSKDFYHTLYSPLLALDARLEIQQPDEKFYVPFSKFEGIRNGQVLSKIRVPLADWDIATFIRLGQGNRIMDVSAGFTFLAKTQKDTIIDLRVAFCGKIKIRSTELENIFIGSKVPISQKSIESAVEFASTLFDGIKAEYEENSNEIIHPMLKAQFVNLLRKNLEKLT